MANIFELLPELQGDELLYIEDLLKDADDDMARRFSVIYRSRRKDPMTILILTLIGFLGIAGIQRFYLDQIGMGLLYLLTAGICFIGTIVDIVTYKKLAFDNNYRVAQEIMVLLKRSQKS